MSKPFNHKQFRRRYVIRGVFLYFLIVYAVAHFGHAVTVQETGKLTGDAIRDALNTMVYHPLQMLPNQGKYLGMGLLAGAFAPLMLSTEYYSKRDLRPAVEHGSAKWNENFEGFQKKFTETDKSLFRPKPILGPKAQNMIIAMGIYLRMSGMITLRNCNILIIGGAGTGKSRGVIKPNLLQANSSYVITDPSGELLESMGGYLEAQGYEIKVFNLVQMRYSDCYNPFAYAKEEEDVISMVSTLIKNTTPTGAKSSDPFWEKSETAIISACCFYLIDQGEPEVCSFGMVARMLNSADAEKNGSTVLDEIFARHAQQHPNSMAVKQYSIYKKAPEETASSIIISAAIRLQSFNLSVVNNLTQADTMELDKVGDRKTAIFCVTPAAKGAYNFLVAMMYDQLFSVLYHHAETECDGKRLPHHVRFMLDEFANIGTIPDFCQRLSTMRKYEISCTIVLQTIDQLKAMYKDEWQVIMGNCDSQIFLGGSDESTLSYMSKLLGKETIRVAGSSRSYGKSGSSSKSYSKVGRELMTMDELRMMDNNYCIYILRGLAPFYVRKYRLEDHPQYKESIKYTYDVKEKKKIEEKEG